MVAAARRHPGARVVKRQEAACATQDLGASVVRVPAGTTTIGGTRSMRTGDSVLHDDS
jgi:hypothetical protein